VVLEIILKFCRKICLPPRFVCKQKDLHTKDMIFHLYVGKYLQLWIQLILIKPCSRSLPSKRRGIFSIVGMPEGLSLAIPCTYHMHNLLKKTCSTVLRPE
jgi:hypothetical protein